MNEAIFSGVLAKIYEQVCKFLGETYNEVKAEVENSYHQYYENYRKRHGQVKVFCVGMREPISLDDVYVDVQFLNQHIVSRYSSPADVEQAFRDRNSRPFDSISDERQDGIQVANSKQYLMLLGAPGVGKSTFLRKVGLEALKGKNGNFEHICVPVYLELKNFKEDEIDIVALITNEFEICGFPHPEELTRTALDLGDLLVLFDGLDEVPRSNVNNVIDKIRDFVDRYNQNRFIASCRIAAYKGGFTRFTEVEMADFDDSQIQDYIKNWFASTPDPHRHQLDESMETADRCWTMLNASEHSATKELARNPLLLTLLCMVYDNSQTLPRNRAVLYEKALDVFLEEWAAEKRVHRGASMNLYLDIADEKRMLSEIAEKNFEENRLFFSKGELITQIREFGEGNANTPETFNAPKILDTILIDQGLFVERVRNSYSFSHLTFQEYLTAKYIVRDTRSIRGLVKKHLHNEQWREVFLLTAGLMHEANDLLVAMEAEAAKLINTPGLKTLFQWAKPITDTSNDQYNQITKRLFALHQYFSLHLLNKKYQIVEYIVKHDLDQDHYLYRALYQALYQHLYQDVYRDINLERDLERDLYQDLNLYRDLAQHLDQDRGQYLYRDLYRYLHLYQDIYQGLNLHLHFYQDFYQYMDAKFYPLVFNEFGGRFDEDLQERIALIKHIEKIKIFKNADLQQMIRRFNKQREFIKGAAAKKDVKSPVKSIHDTWLSVLGITDEMLDISSEELGTYLQYFYAVDLIFACKEAAGRVSPKVWQGIQDRFFAMDSSSVPPLNPENV